MKIKVDIISGFLGAGKTTLIKKLLSEKLLGEKLVLIENEFGEIGIDGSVFDKGEIEIKEISSGCICCSLVGDFEQAILEVINQIKPKRIIIEPSGVGMLSDIINACQSSQLKELLQVNMIITVVDCVKYSVYMNNFAEFYQDQVENTKTIVLSRTQKTTKDKLNSVVDEIRKINQQAPIVTTPWEKMEAEQIMLIAEGNPEKAFVAQLEHDQTHQHNHHCGCGCQQKPKQNANEAFDNWGLETPRTFSETKLKHILESLSSGSFGTVLRGKGIVETDNGEWVQFNYVPGECEIKVCPPNYSGRVCVIGRELNKTRLDKLFKEELEQE